MPQLGGPFGRFRATRRQFLGASLLGALMTPPLAACRAIIGDRPAGSSGILRFLDTNRDSETTRQLIEAFRQNQPAWQIQRDEVAPERLSTTFAAEQASRIPRDLAFLPGKDLTPQVSRRWLRDLSQLPGAAALTRAAFPFVNEQTHQHGQRYAVPAWVRLHGFFYNRQYLQTISEPTPPRTFDEIHSVARAIQRRHLGNYAFFWPIKNGLGIFRDEFVASGHPMFSASLAPTFLTDPIFRQVLNWRLQAFYDWGIVDPRGLNSADIDQSFPHGWASFTWDTFDSLRYWQTSGRYLAGGNLANALCPSWTDRHESIAEADLYAIPVTSGQVSSAWEFARYLGGDGGGNFPSSRAHWHSSGLVFGYSSLLNDQDLVSSGAAWCDISAFRMQLQQAIAPPGRAALGYVEWLDSATIQSSLLLRQKITPDEFIHRLDARWNELQAATPP